MLLPAGLWPAPPVCHFGGSPCAAGPWPSPPSPPPGDVPPLHRRLSAAKGLWHGCCHLSKTPLSRSSRRRPLCPACLRGLSNLCTTLAGGCSAPFLPHRSSMRVVQDSWVRTWTRCRLPGMVVPEGPCGPLDPTCWELGSFSLSSGEPDFLQAQSGAGSVL